MTYRNIKPEFPFSLKGKHNTLLTINNELAKALGFVRNDKVLRRDYQVYICSLANQRSHTNKDNHKVSAKDIKHLESPTKNWGVSVYTFDILEVIIETMLATKEFTYRAPAEDELSVAKFLLKYTISMIDYSLAWLDVDDNISRTKYAAEYKELKVRKEKFEAKYSCTFNGLWK